MPILNQVPVMMQPAPFNVFVQQPTPAPTQRPGLAPMTASPMMAQQSSSDDMSEERLEEKARGW